MRVALCALVGNLETGARRLGAPLVPSTAGNGGLLVQTVMFPVIKEYAAPFDAVRIADDSNQRKGNPSPLAGEGCGGLANEVSLAGAG